MIDTAFYRNDLKRIHLSHQMLLMPVSLCDSHLFAIIRSQQK